MIDVRLAAAQVLLALDAGETTLGAEIAAVRPGVVPRDDGLLVELTSGVLRWRAELDTFVAAASQRSVRDVDPRALTALRLGAYQLRHLDRIPHHAIVHTSVEVVRGLGAPKAAGFVNAALRSLLRRQHAIALPPRPGPHATREAQLAYLAVTLSHPRWLVRRWLDRMGFDTTEAWCTFNNRAPDVTVRPAGRLSVAALIARLAEEHVAAAPAPYVEDAVRLPAGGLGRVSPELRAELVVQDEGAQLVARAAAAAPGETVLDVCAAPGGKTLMLARDLDSGGAAGSRLIAADHRSARIALLRDTLRQAGCSAPIVRLDAREPLPFAPVFDAVLLDAPCSGLGTLRRDPDVKWSRREEDLPRLAATARDMLQRAALVVRPGGRVVYATCSSEPEENASVVAAFLADNPTFHLADWPGPRRVPAAVLDDQGRLVTEPARHGLEAFFAAVLVRRQGAQYTF